jgi:hypothetical protein
MTHFVCGFPFAVFLRSEHIGSQLCPLKALSASLMCSLQAKAEVFMPRLLRKRFYADVSAGRTGKRIALSDFVLIPMLN